VAPLTARPRSRPSRISGAIMEGLSIESCIRPATRSCTAFAAVR
jgi:hypothetical protein